MLLSIAPQIIYYLLSIANTDISYPSPIIKSLGIASNLFYFVPGRLRELSSISQILPSHRFLFSRIDTRISSGITVLPSSEVHTLFLATKTVTYAFSCGFVKKRTDYARKSLWVQKMVLWLVTRCNFHISQHKMTRQNIYLTFNMKNILI